MIQTDIYFAVKIDWNGFKEIGFWGIRCHSFWMSCMPFWRICSHLFSGYKSITVKTSLNENEVEENDIHAAECVTQDIFTFIFNSLSPSLSLSVWTNFTPKIKNMLNVNLAPIILCHIIYYIYITPNSVKYSQWIYATTAIESQKRTKQNRTIRFIFFLRTKFGRLQSLSECDWVTIDRNKRCKRKTQRRKKLFRSHHHFSSLSADWNRFVLHI